ncbi:hypothetical protein ACS0TY_003491 [Phlomoides rotata]
MDTAGPQFTWVTRCSNHGYMTARLDRVLANDDFLDLWHSTSATVLPRISSDHHPIILRLHKSSGHVKLKRLKATLKNWNRVVFKNIYVEMEEASEALNAIQAEAALYGDTEDRLSTKIDCTTSVGLYSLIVNGDITFDPGIIADSVVQFYTELFTAQDQPTYDDSVLAAFIHPVVEAADNDALLALPSLEEI